MVNKLGKTVCEVCSYPGIVSVMAVSEAKWPNIWETKDKLDVEQLSWGLWNLSGALFESTSCIIRQAALCPYSPLGEGVSKPENKYIKGHETQRRGWWETERCQSQDCGEKSCLLLNFLCCHEGKSWAAFSQGCVHEDFSGISPSNVLTGLIRNFLLSANMVSLLSFHHHRYKGASPAEPNRWGPISHWTLFKILCWIKWKAYFLRLTCSAVTQWGRLAYSALVWVVFLMWPGLPLTSLLLGVLLQQAGGKCHRCLFSSTWMFHLGNAVALHL